MWKTSTHTRQGEDCWVTLQSFQLINWQVRGYTPAAVYKTVMSPGGLASEFHYGAVDKYWSKSSIIWLREVLSVDRHVATYVYKSLARGAHLRFPCSDVVSIESSKILCFSQHNTE